MKNKAAIDAMKMSRPGDHMVVLYENDDYNTDVIAAYIVSRLEKNEKCFYIDGDIDTDMLRNKLSYFLDYEKYIKSGQLSMLSKEDAYSKEGKFNPDNMIHLLKTLADEAINEGYEAFAITGEISWVLEYDSGFEKIMDYEFKLNQHIFGEYPVSAICRYNLNSFSSEMIKSIIEVHPFIIWKGEVHDNPFYIESVDSKTVNVDSYHVENMLKQITEFTNTKSRHNIEMKKKESEYQMLHMKMLRNIIVSLTSLLEMHDEYTKHHSEQVAGIAKRIAEEMGLPLEERNKIYYAGLVHDIGKTIIPANIINKKGSLTEEEYEIVKLHPSNGYNTLVKTPELKDIAELVQKHHERYDGKGYPTGSLGDETPIGARILQIADSYDAMVNDRPYRKAFSINEAILEIRRCSGAQFDPVLVEVLVKVIEKKDKMSKKAI